MIAAGLRHHRLAPDAHFLEGCARALLDADPGPDLSAWCVVVPNLVIAPDFKRTLARTAGRSLLLPAVDTLQGHLASRVACAPVLSAHRRRFALYRQLRERRWFERGNLWALCAEFIELFDELTVHGARCPADEAELAAQLAHAYAAREDDALRFEASVVHQLWRAESEGSPSLAAARLLAAAAWTREAPSPLLVLSEGALPAPWRAWLAAHGERAPVLVCEADRHLHDVPSLRLAAAAWPAEEAPPPLAERIAAVGEDGALDARVRLVAAQSLEHAAHAVAVEVRRALADGAGAVALVAVDRLAARRARALLERDGILVEDESGWRLSTTRAAALVDACVEVLVRDAYHRDLLDLCKSPFVFADVPAGARQEAVLAIEHAVREAGLVAGLDALAGLRFDDPMAPELVSRLQSARAAFPTRAAPPQRWLVRLLAALEALGAIGPLRADAAGAVLLEWLEARVAELQDEPCTLDVDEWRAWLDAGLDEAMFRDRSIRSPVVMTHLPACRLRGFDVAVVIGADAEQLRPDTHRPVFAHEGVRRDLGLPGSMDALARLREDLAALVAASGRVVFTWQRLKDGEPCQLAAELDLLDLAHTLRYGRSLVEQAPPLPVPEVGWEGQPVPAPRISPVRRPTRITAYGYEALIACPYQYFVRFVLGLDEAAEVREALEKRDYGQLVHEVLERFHERYPRISGEDDAHLLVVLGQISDAVFAEHLAANFLETAWYVRWRRQWPAYLDWQRAREAAGWSWGAGERSLSRPLALADGGALQLTGRLDRIDHGPDATRAVLDYKTRDRAALAKKARDAEDVQLAVYAALAGADVVEAGYVSLDGERIETLALADPQAAAEAQLARLTGLFGRLGAGAPMPANGVGEACAWCAVRGVCRKDYHDE